MDFLRLTILPHSGRSAIRVHFSGAPSSLLRRPSLSSLLDRRSSSETSLLDAAVWWLRPGPVAARTRYTRRLDRDWSTREAAGPCYDLQLLARRVA